MKAVRVPKKFAEEVRKFVESRGIKDRSRLIIQDGNYVEIPILDGYEHLFSFEVVEQKNPVFVQRKDLRSMLTEVIPKDLYAFVPRSYKVVGDIILIKIPEELEEYKEVIGKTLLRLHPRCKSVWRDLGKEGIYRKPRLEIIAGSGSETVHRENGCLFKLDVTKVMFSVGNQGERMRIARLVRDGERIVDMFAGIGYFSIPIAVHSNPKEITAIEINPDAYRFLLENIKLNCVKTIHPVLGDSMDSTPERSADRVIMGHLFCHEFLPVAIRAIDGRGTIHYHESTPEAVIDRPVRRIRKACEREGKKCRILNFRKVKNYSPGVYHLVVDAYIY